MQRAGKPCGRTGISRIALETIASKQGRLASSRDAFETQERENIEPSRRDALPISHEIMQNTKDSIQRTVSFSPATTELSIGVIFSSRTLTARSRLRSIAAHDCHLPCDMKKCSVICSPAPAREQVLRLELKEHPILRRE